MKSDISRFGEKLVLRDAELRQATAKADQVSERFVPASNPQVGYKLPFSIGSRPFVTHEGQHSEQMRHQHGEGTGRLFIGASLPTLETAPSSTFCRACPQYGHALIFPRKCYYEAQCPLPLLFCAKQHREGEEKAVKTTLVHWHGRIGTHPTQNFLRRLSSTLSKRIAYNDPTRENTNFGWRRKA